MAEWRFWAPPLAGAIGGIVGLFVFGEQPQIAAECILVGPPALGVFVGIAWDGWHRGDWR